MSTKSRLLNDVTHLKSTTHCGRGLEHGKLSYRKHTWYTSKQHEIQLHTNNRYVSISVCRLRLLIQLVAEMASQAFVCRVTGSCLSWHSQLNLWCILTYILIWLWKHSLWLSNREDREVAAVNCITPHTTRYNSVLHRVVDFWCSRLLVLTTSIMWLCLCNTHATYGSIKY